MRRIRVGERSSSRQAAICAELAVIGVGLDRDPNAQARSDGQIAAAGSRVPAWVVEATQEVVAARAARALIS